ncbi:FAD-binding oxidoreductase [Aneurinibacillus migulanus]|uniref:FAD-binding oxidoreductase n=1 Tax=Aneurinibacillus migulanus TaxID=47500 RepID=UPI0020A07C84|nr:FAD-linked oxidase C-terminal domain-containing protein [Aneurinibacillus migulanus]MCP1356123.1 FAD-binding protein [Aneurinibacillus migulanus]
MTSAHIEEVMSIVKTGRVLTNESDRFSYSFDGSFGTYLPDAVIQTKSVEELASLVKFANRERIPVYPRGQSTCLSGGPLPVKGGMVFDLSVMNDLLEISEEDLVAVVSPGVLTADIHKAAEKKGLLYPPDPSSSHVSTIGGNMAENSGGPRGLKYGVTKDYVIGLELITPEGEIIKTGGRTVKNVTGYDLTKLIVGSEGTLGIITKAVLRLLPKPPASETVMAVFNNLVDAGSAISKILSAGILPAKMELMDQASIAAVENYEPLGLPVDAEAIILLELDGHPAALKDEVKQAAELCKSVGARDIRIPQNAVERAEVWRARKLVSPAIVRIKPTKISEDATVPRSKIPQMCERLQQIRDKYNVHLVVFGHAGDGNLHPNIICDKSDKEEMNRVEQAVAEIFTAAVELGGTLSGEHGIGTMKAPFMEMELGTVGLDMMKRIKEAWDPNNIMNPGKIFPEPGQKLELS